MAQHASYIAGGAGYQPADMMQRDNDWINPGVISSSDLVVTPGTGLSVNVSGAAQGSVGGGAWLPNGYRFYNDSTATIALAAANATYARIDLIVAAIDTSQNPYAPEIIAITGTPAASPAIPTVPGTLVYISLAQVYVAANATTISAGNITDVRIIAVLDGTIPYNPTSNSGNAYSVTLPNITALTDGLPIRVKFNAASTGAITLNVNGLGAKSVIDYFGNAVTNVRQYLPANLCYEAISGTFTLLGKGGGGNTIAAHVLINDTCTTDSGPITGTMPNQGSPTLNPGASITAGYYSGGSVASIPHNTQTYTTPGTYTWTVPANVTKVFIAVTGGGGGGGGGIYNGSYGGGGGGGGGSYIDVVTVTPGNNISVVVGTGGAAGSGSGAGSNGGSSSFSSYTANGGNGGYAGGNSVGMGNGNTGGTGGGTFGMSGGAGTNCSSYLGGTGGVGANGGGTYGTGGTGMNSLNGNGQTAGACGRVVINW